MKAFFKTLEWLRIYLQITENVLLIDVQKNLNPLWPVLAVSILEGLRFGKWNSRCPSFICQFAMQLRTGNFIIGQWLSISFRIASSQTLPDFEMRLTYCSLIYRFSNAFVTRLSDTSASHMLYMNCYAHVSTLVCLNW